MAPMLALTAPVLDPHPEAHVGPGGFFWWYADWMDDAGRGLVAIWSWGLPFLPGYGGAARSGQPQAPLSRPSFNLAAYEKGRCVAYFLQEYDPSDVEIGARRWRMGDGELLQEQEGDRLKVTAKVDCPLPGTRERVTGTLSLSGPLRQAAPQERPAGGPHLWTPLVSPATGEASLHSAGWSFALRGRAYHDRNQSLLPLHALGIQEWIWARVAFPSGERILYLLWPATPDAEPLWLGLELDAAGRSRWVEGLQVKTQGWTTDLYGLRWPATVTVDAAGAPWMRLQLDKPIENGPFYLRFRCTAQVAAETGQGWGELVRPDRIDLDWQRVFIRMRVHDLRGANSLLLPLFMGPETGRWGRLWGHLTNLGRPVR